MSLKHELKCKAYHTIIRDLEYPRVISDPTWRNIYNYDYILTEDEILSCLSHALSINKDKSEEIFNELVKDGFLISVPSKYGQETGNFRSLHMDILLRSAKIRTYYGEYSYIVNPRLFVYEIPLASVHDRRYRKSYNDLIFTKFVDALKFFFGRNEVVQGLFDIIFNYLGESGLDAFQVYSLATMLSKSSSKSFLIVAPTGSGKTEIFLFYCLAKAIKSKIEGKKKRIVLIYPRKALSIDQTERILRLLWYANLYLSKYKISISFGLRDGETPRDENDRENIPQDMNFRGLSCPRCSAPLIYNLASAIHNVKCSKCSEIFQFIRATRKSMGLDPPDFLVTNTWALENRLMDSSVSDITAGFFENLDVLVLDEVHEYIGLKGGIVSCLIKLLDSISYGSSSIILSSATVPSPDKFMQELLGKIHRDHIILSFNDIHDTLLKEYNVRISGKRLILMATFEMHPMYSWNTYVQLWTVMMSFLSYAYSHSERKFYPQAIVFINNIKELRRAHRGFEENISLGEPRDHITMTYGLNQPAIDPYVYWHYASPQLIEKLNDILLKKNRLNELKDFVYEVHSDVDASERREVLKNLRLGKDVAVVLSTSSLELGVDYKNVSFILNIGLESPIVLAQRIGRGGRDYNSLRTVLGIILSRKIPSESLLLYSSDLDKKLNPALGPKDLELKIPIASRNPQVLKRGYLVAAFSELARRGVRTHASERPIQSIPDLNEVLENIIKVVEVREFERKYEL